MSFVSDSSNELLGSTDFQAKKCWGPGTDKLLEGTFWSRLTQFGQEPYETAAFNLLTAFYADPLI